MTQLIGEQSLHGEDTRFQQEEDVSEDSDECSGDGLLQELTFEQRCDFLEDAILKHSLHREIHYKTLALCQERRLFFEVEEAIAQFPEFKRATQSQYHLITILQQAGGLLRIDPEEGEGLDVGGQGDDQDKHAEKKPTAQTYVTTTDVGNEIVARHQPVLRLQELFDNEPDRVEAYLSVLEFCGQKLRTYREIEEVLEGNSALIRDQNGHKQQMQSSVLVDRLERAGGVVWDEGWKSTKEGKELLRQWSPDQ